mmetsp:Transcript_7563/g.11226  ORF Transcript_7563/g.11226 Transcript_7563/m.11226 type:complete len:147 (+) Transcript_7563:31-471(+)
MPADKMFILAKNIPIRQQVLSMYRYILKSSYTWKGPQEDRDYIAAEAKRLFRKNKNLTDEDEIEKVLFEGESRIVIAEHYKICYPRPYNNPKGTKGGSQDVEHEREKFVPAYNYTDFNEIAKEQNKYWIEKRKKNKLFDEDRDNNW